MKNSSLLIGSAIFALSSYTYAATVTIGAGTYTENFNTLSASQEPAPGWDVRRVATGSSLGASKRSLLGVLPWADTGSAFRNVSSNNIPQTSDAAAQAANPNRVLAYRQTTPSGDPGAAFSFNFSSTGVLLDSLAIDLLLLDSGAASTTLSLQYGIGTSPTSFTTLTTWSDLNVAGGFGSTTFTFDRDDFGSSLDDQSQAWFRVVALTLATSGGGVYDLMAIDNFSVTANPVPEPSAMLLGCLGVLSFLGARRR